MSISFEQRHERLREERQEMVDAIEQFSGILSACLQAPDRWTGTQARKTRYALAMMNMIGELVVEVDEEIASYEMCIASRESQE